MNIEQMTDAEIEKFEAMCIDPVDANGWGFLNRKTFARAILAARDAQWNALIAGQAGAAVAQDAFAKALSIRTAQGWSLTGKAVPVLYTDAINGEQVSRDDLWLCTTSALASLPAPQVAQAEQAEAPSDVADEFAHSKYASTTARNIALLDEIERLRAIQPATSKTAPASRPEFVSLEEHDRILQAVRQPTASNAGEPEPASIKALRDALALQGVPIGNMVDRHTAIERILKAQTAWQAACTPDTIKWLLNRAALATKPPAGEQKPVEGGANYSLTIVADSGYEATTEGRCTAEQYGAAIGALHGVVAQPEQVAQDSAGQLLATLKERGLIDNYSGGIGNAGNVTKEQANDAR